MHKRGGGGVCLERVAAISVTEWSAMEIDVQDAGLVFDLTDDGDGTIGPDEMSHGSWFTF